MLDARRLFGYFRLTADRRIVYGGGRPRYRWGGATTDGAGAAAALDELAAELGAVLGTTEVRIAGGWTGVIDYVLDGLPAIHAMPGNPSVVHAVGWCGHGIALALASGPWVADLVTKWGATGGPSVVPDAHAAGSRRSLALVGVPRGGDGHGGRRPLALSVHIVLARATSWSRAVPHPWWKPISAWRFMLASSACITCAW